MDHSDGVYACIAENPKFTQNLGAVLRACACFEVPNLLWTGGRIDLNIADRTPREFRMKEYKGVQLTHADRPFDLLPKGVVPVCVELLPNATPLWKFVHPDRAAYVFGPEDGDVSQVFRRFCHHFVYVPSKFCLNLAATVNVVLYDRSSKRRS